MVCARTYQSEAHGSIPSSYNIPPYPPNCKYSSRMDPSSENECSAFVRMFPEVVERTDVVEYSGSVYFVIPK